MAKKVIIVESPNKAREISHMQSAKGYEITATVGHIVDLPRNTMSVEVKKEGSKEHVVFDMQVMPDKKKVVSDIRAKCRGAEVLIASDPDREGEKIAWDVENIVSKDAKSVDRIEFHAITDAEVGKALKNRRKVNERLVESAVARRLIDRLIGYSLSGKAADSLSLPFGAVSVGRVQLATVKMVYDREMGIRNHVPEPRWKVVVRDSHGAEFSSVVFKEKAPAEQLAAKLSKGIVVSGTVLEKKEEKTPKPLTASLMQQTANRKFKWNSEKTMDLAQKLFEKGAISYHRTDSVRVSDETKTLVRDYLALYGKQYVPATSPVHKNGNRTQDAHECIHPTDMNVAPDAFPGDEATLYGLIRDIFSASQSTPAVWDATTVKAGAVDCPDALTATGKRLVFDGWRKFAGHFSGKDDRNVVLEHAYKKGERVDGSPKLDMTMTKPPARFTEATLIGEMEKRGVGRPSTYANTMKVIRSRGYVGVDKTGAFSLTPLAEKLTEWGLKACPEFVDIEYTSKMEEVLDSIELGEGDWEKLVVDTNGEVDRAKARSGSVTGVAVSKEMLAQSGGKFAHASKTTSKSRTFSKSRSASVGTRKSSTGSYRER